METGNKNETAYSLLGCLPRAMTGNFLVGIFFLLLGIFLGGPRIYIEIQEAVFVFCLLLALYVAITWWSIWTLAKYKAKKNLVTEGPYHFVRSPMYAAVIFILNPALGILFRSWLLVLASILIYFIWQKCVLKEEQHLVEKFGQAYIDYRSRVGRFFPKIWQTNKVVFYSLLAILIFSGTFVFLNFSSFYLRWAVWMEKGEIVYDQSFSRSAGFFSVNQDNSLGSSQGNSNDSLTNQSQFTSNQTQSVSGQAQFIPGQTQSAAAPSANYNASPNSIYIAKIGVRAPIVSPSGTKQAELNAALNQGVVLYPGSALPGQSGEVALTGHSSVFPWNKTSYGQIFALLDKVEKGNVISLIYNNYQYDYQVTGKAVLLPSQVKTSPTLEQTLMISTCWPIGTSLKRLVVYGELIK